jgi:hypothetical protein
MMRAAAGWWPAAVLLAAMGCDGAAPTASPDAAVASADAPVNAPPFAGTSPLAGVWTGTTDQEMAVSLVVGEDGLITDLAVRIQLVDDSGGECNANFQASRLVPVRDGTASLEVTSNVVLNVRRPVNVHFGADGTATGTLAARTTPSIVTCSGGVNGQAAASLPAIPFRLRRTADRFRPGADDHLVASRAGLPLPIGNCSHQLGSPHSFCAFAKRNVLGEGELWVVDTARPVAASCGEISSPDTGCQRLTSRLWMELPRSTKVRTTSVGFPDTYGFQGDTMLFAADGRTTPWGFRGALFAWRPGWQQPLRLVQDALSCQVDPYSDAIACIGDLDDAVYEPFTPGPFRGGLYAGRLGDGLQPLQQVARLLLVTAAEDARAVPLVRHSYAISPGGDHLVWSAREADTPDAKSVLSIAPLANLQAPRGLGGDLFSWRLSPEGRRLFWLRETASRPPGPWVGILEMLDLTGGPAAAPVALSNETVGSFALTGEWGKRAVPALALEGKGQLSFSADVTAPVPEWRSVDSDVDAIRSWIPGGNRVAYAKSTLVDARGWGDLYLADIAGTTCEVGIVSEWASPTFSSTGDHVLAWRLTEDERTDHSDLALIDARDCQVLQTYLRPRNRMQLPDGRFLVAAADQPLRKFGIATLGVLDPARPAVIEPIATGVSGVWHGQLPPGERPDHIDVWFGVNAGWASDGLYRRRIPLLKH